MNNLSVEDQLRMSLVDDCLFSRNPNYLEDAIDDAKSVRERISKLIDIRKFESIEAIELLKIYENIKFRYLLQLI